MNKFVKNFLFAVALFVGVGSAFASLPGKPFANQLRYWKDGAFIPVPNGHTVTCAGTTGNCTEQYDADGNPIPSTLVMGTPTLH